MNRGTGRVAPLLIAVLVWGLLGSPAQADEPISLGPVGPTSRCVDHGVAMELPLVQRVGGEPLTGRLVRWEYRTDTADEGAWTATDPVPIDEQGFAAPPTIDAAVPERAQVRVAVLTSAGRWLRVGNLVVYKAARTTLLRDADVRLDAPAEKPWSREILVGGVSPLYEAPRADGGCEGVPARGVDVDVWATHEVTGERSLLGRVAVERSIWSLKTYLPTTGPYRVSIDQVRGDDRRTIATDASVTAVPDTTRLGVNVPKGVTWTTAPAGHLMWWMPRGARFSLDVRQGQDEWRPVELDGSARSVGVRFTPSFSTTTRQLPDVVLTRAASVRSGSQPHTMTGRGRFTLVLAATPTEQSSRASLDVRFLPRISFPARTTKVRAHRPVSRTVTIQDGVGLKAELQYWNPRSGWDPAGLERSISSAGKVRLTAPGARGTRKYRVVVYSPGIGGGLEPVVVSRATWTVRHG